LRGTDRVGHPEQGLLKRHMRSGDRWTRYGGEWTSSEHMQRYKSPGAKVENSPSRTLFSAWATLHKVRCDPWTVGLSENRSPYLGHYIELRPLQQETTSE